jgi:16S rRNA processing protein RimM
MIPIRDDSWVWVGRVVKTHGIKGEVKISVAEGTSTFGKGIPVTLESAEGKRRALTVETGKARGVLSILSFREIKKIEEAQELVGCSVFVNKESLKPLPAGEFYGYQLVGLQVQTEGGREIGTIEAIMPTGSNDVFVVRRDGRETLIPAIEEVVVRVDLGEKRMIIRPLEGLLGENDL